jgi:hypothetical protein
MSKANCQTQSKDPYELASQSAMRGVLSTCGRNNTIYTHLNDDLIE